ASANFRRRNKATKNLARATFNCHIQGMTMRRWMTTEGVELDLDELTEEEAQLFEQAKKLFDAKASMMDIAKLYTSNDSILYKGRSRVDVVDLSIYRAIKDMARRRGIEAGELEGPYAN